MSSLLTATKDNNLAICLELKFFFHRMKFQIFVLAIATLMATICAEEEQQPEAARLLVSKHILNKYLVENMDVIVKVYDKIKKKNY